MKKILKNILLTTIALAALTILGYYTYLYLYLLYIEELTYHATEDVIVIQDILTSSYLVETDSGYIAVDCGFNNDILWRAFYYNGINVNEIHTVLLTHSDVDHTNGLNVYENANVYISEKELEMINSGTQRFGFFPFLTNSLERENINTLNDNDSLFVDGIKIKCIALPGHTLGSMGYIVNDMYLFTGDAFRIKNGRLKVPFKKMYAMDVDEMKKTIKKLAKLKGIKYIFSAHSGFTADFDFALSNEDSK
jgi:glyoxylase-like metal-dependent hydrolase (beta-lactamase superfamily II)